MAYGDKRNYPKIEIFVDGDYRATTTWSRTLDEARRKFAEATGTPMHQIRAHYRDPRPRRRRDPEHALEILSVNRRHPNGIHYLVRVPTTKVRRGYDLVDVLFHDNGATSTKSANRLTSTPTIAARFAREHGPSYQPGRGPRAGMHGI